MITIDTNANRNWLSDSSNLISKGDLICITREEFTSSDSKPLQWFGTNLIQYLNRQKDTEICPLYGKQIKSIDDFCYQLCRSIPWGFEMGRNIHAIYDVILNFETQPKNRYFIWYDSQFLYNYDKSLFEDIFECLVVAGYLNSIGKATQDYQVNQKNIFLFDNIEIDDIKYLLEKEYYTPRIDNDSKDIDSSNMRHDFNILLIK